MVNYPQNWQAYNLAQTQELELLIKILEELIDESVIFRKSLPRRGRPQLNMKDMIIACTLKVYFGKSLRRGISFLNIFGTLKKVPHFSSVSNYFNNKALTPVFKHLIEQSGTPLKAVEQDFAVDSSGFSTRMFGRWFDIRIAKPSKKRLWKKAHITCGTKTNVVTAVEITPGYFNDCPVFADLVKTTSKNFEVREVSADKAYLSKANLQLVSELGAVPYIPFKSNTAMRRSPEIWKAMKKYFDEHREEFMSHYHKRSNVESTFGMIKRKFDNRLFSKSETGQVNEILCKILCHNICVLIQELFELNTDIKFNISTKVPIEVRND